MSKLDKSPEVNSTISEINKKFLSISHDLTTLKLEDGKRKLRKGKLSQARNEFKYAILLLKLGLKGTDGLKPDPIYYWNFFELCVFHAYTLHSISMMEQNTEHTLPEMTQSLKMARKSKFKYSIINEELSKHSDLKTFYDDLCAAYKIPLDFARPSLEELQQMDNAMEFARLNELFIATSEINDNNKTPLYLAVKFKLNYYVQHLLSNEKEPVDFEHIDIKNRTIIQYTKKIKYEAALTAFKKLVEIRKQNKRELKALIDFFNQKEAHWKTTPVTLPSSIGEIEERKLNKSLLELLNPADLSDNPNSPVVVFNGEQSNIGSIKQVWHQYFFKELASSSKPGSSSDTSLTPQSFNDHSHEFAGLTLKENPKFPGTQFIASSLGNLLTEKVTFPTQVAKATYNEQSKIVQISCSPGGLSINHALQWKPNYLKKVDPVNFSQMVLLSLITMPSHGDGSNYHFLPEYDPQSGAFLRGTYTSWGNEKGFINPVRSNDFGHVIEFKCILLLLEDMNKPVHPESKQFFLALNPEKIIVQWLQSIQYKNIAYEQLIEQQSDVWTENDLNQLQLPIRLSLQTVKNVYARIKLIQTLLAADQNNELTHNILFKHVAPLVHKVYESLLAKENDPVKVINQLYKSPTIETLLHDELDTEIAPGVTVTSYLKQYDEHPEDDFSSLTDSVESVINDFITFISLSSLAPKDELELILQIGLSPVPVNYLILRDSSLTTRELNQYLLSPLSKKQNTLKRLVLVNCAQIKKENQTEALGQHYSIKIQEVQTLEECTLIKNKPPVFLKYSDQDIHDCLEACLQDAPFNGHGVNIYKVLLANNNPASLDVNENQCQLFLLPALDNLGNVPADSFSLTSLPLSYHFNRSLRPMTVLAELASDACEQDSIESIQTILQQAQADGNEMSTLQELCNEYQSWDELKPRLQQLIENEQKADVIDEVMASLEHHNSPATVLFPFNLDQAHWLTGELSFQLTGDVININAFAHDPYGHGQMPVNVADQIHQAIVSKLPTYRINFNRMESVYNARQSPADRVSCGAIVIRDILTRMKGQSLDMTRPYPVGAQELRTEQSRKINRNLGISGSDFQGQIEYFIEKPIVSTIDYFNQNTHETESYAVSQDGYSMVLDAIKSSSAKKSYLPFIMLLIDKSYSRSSYSSDEEHQEAVEHYVASNLRKYGHFNDILEQIPLNCRIHFSARNYLKLLTKLAGTVDADHKNPHYNRNLAEIAVLFSTPFMQSTSKNYGTVCQHTIDIAHYFRDTFPSLWSEKNDLNFSAEMLYRLLHQTDSLDRELIANIPNDTLLTANRHMVSFWRLLHAYLQEWDARHKRLSTIVRKDNLFYLVAEKIIQHVYNKDLFYDRHTTALKALAIVDAMLHSPCAEHIIALERLLETMQSTLLNGSSLRKIMKNFLGPDQKLEALSTISDNTVAQAKKCQPDRQISTHAQVLQLLPETASIESVCDQEGSLEQNKEDKTVEELNLDEQREQNLPGKRHSTDQINTVTTTKNPVYSVRFYPSEPAEQNTTDISNNEHRDFASPKGTDELFSDSDTALDL